ncbi:MAG: CHAT domain-containing protein [Sphingomonadaceae bacterium]
MRLRRLTLAWATGLALILGATASLAQDTTLPPGSDDVATLIAEGQLAEALARAETFLASAQSAHGRDSREAAEARLPLAYALFASGQLDRAVTAMSERAAIHTRLSGANSDLAVRAESDLTSVMIDAARRHGDAGNWAASEPLWERVVTNYARFRGEGDRDGLNFRRQLATSIKNQGRPADAEPVMRRTLELADNQLGPDDLVTLDIINDLGRVVEAQGRHSEAERLYREARSKGEARFGPDHPGVLVYGQNLGASLLYQGRLADAEPIARDVLERRKRVLGPDDPHTLYSMSDLASILTFGEDPARAGPIWTELLERAERTLGKDHPQIAEMRTSYAVYLDRAGTSPLAALAEAREAAAAVRARRSAVGLDPRGQRSLANFTEIDAFYFKLLLHTLRQAGDAQTDLPLPRRVALFNEAFVSIQEAMENPANMAVIRRTAERAAAQRGPELARLASERQTLSDQWVSSANDRREALASQASGIRLAELEQAQRAIEARIAQIDERFAAEFPDFFALLRPAAVTADEMRVMLKQTPDEAVVMVLPTAFGTHVIALSGTRMDWQVSDLAEPVINLAVKRLRWDLGASVDVSPKEEEEWLAEGEGAYPFDRAMAFGLYRQLIEPVEHVLAGKRHVYVVAGGSLSSLPFGVLVTEQPQGQDGDPANLRATRWLADKYALVQLPSLQSLGFLRRFGSSDAETSGFIGFGDPVLDGRAVQRGGGKAVRGTRGGAIPVAAGYRDQARGGAPTVDLAALRALARLPGTAEELEKIRRVLNAPASAVMMGAQATERAVKRSDLSKASVIAFATHGLLAGEIDGASEPGLVFTPPAQASAEDDGLLSMSEIAALRMNADWVILSACNTAAGDGSQGASGLSGLARAFFLAGAKSLLASHWPVRDDVAAQLTVRAIAIGSQNRTLSRAEALQRAMQEIRNNPSRDSDSDTWAHPNAWAPFTLIGDASGR